MKSLSILTTITNFSKLGIKLSLPEATKLNRLQNLILHHKHKVSYDNGYYWWNLKTDKTVRAYSDFCKVFAKTYDGKIKEQQFVTALYIYFDVVYQESLRLWTENREELRRLDAEARIEMPVEDVKLYRKELAFLNERFCNWLAKDNELIVDDDINDNIEPKIYHEIPVIDKTIRSLDTVLEFGKYSKNGELGKYRPYTIREVLEINPQYIQWASENIDRFRVSDEIKLEIKAWVEHFDSKEKMRKYERRDQ